MIFCDYINVTFIIFEYFEVLEKVTVKDSLNRINIQVSAEMQEQSLVMFKTKCLQLKHIK